MYRKIDAIVKISSAQTSAFSSAAECARKFVWRSMRIFSAFILSQNFMKNLNPLCKLVNALEYIGGCHIWFHSPCSNVSQCRIWNYIDDFNCMNFSCEQRRIIPFLESLFCSTLALWCYLFRELYSSLISQRPPHWILGDCWPVAATEWFILLFSNKSVTIHHPIIVASSPQAYLQWLPWDRSLVLWY